MLFGNGIWIHPDRYEVETNERLSFVYEEDKIHVDWSHYDMVTFNNKVSIIAEVYTLTATKDKQRVFDLPSFDRYYTYLVFKGGLLISNDRITIKNDQLYFNNRNDYIEKGRNTYLIKLTNPNIDDETYPTFLQITIKPTSNGTNIPIDWQPYESRLMIFLGGRYLASELFTIKNHRIYLEDETIDIGHKSFTLVYLSPYPMGEYSYAIEPRTITNGEVTFTSFNNYTLTKGNFLLFGNGTWIHPDRYNIDSNSKLSFIDEEDKLHVDWVHYTMIIPNERTERDSENAVPVDIQIHTLTATEEEQRVFTIPEIPKYSTYIIFKGALLLPNETVEVNRTELRFKKQSDYLALDRSLYLVILTKSDNLTRRYPAIIQETFAANSNPAEGTKIPSDWYFYEDGMIVFLGGRYLDPVLYRIKNHKIYLNDQQDVPEIVKSNNKIRHYTLLYMGAKIMEDYKEEIIPFPEEEIPIKERIIPEDDPIDYHGYYFDSYTSNLSSSGDITYNPKFDPYLLNKEDIMLFGNSTFIHPLRYRIVNNGLLRMNDQIDIKHVQWAHYDLVLPFSKDNHDLYQENYVKVKLKTIELVTTELSSEISFPIVDSIYESFIMFRKSLIIPIFDEDRFIIDDINHKIKIINEQDYIPKNTTVTFIFLSSETNTDKKIVFVQDSFRCVDLETQLPNSIYRYPTKKFSKTKMMLFLNGSYLSREQYRVANNTIYLVDDDIDLLRKNIYTIVYIDEIDPIDNGLYKNLIGRTFEKGLDNIIFETYVVKPIA